MPNLQKTLSTLTKKAVAKVKKIVYGADNPTFNVFHKEYKKYALVSYITAPFKIGNQYRHNNEKAVQEIARLMDELGYVVDVINCTDTREYSYEKYSAIIGFGDPFCNSFATNPTAKRIYYGTGMEVSSHNYGAIQRLKDFYSKHKVWLTESSRLVNQTWSLQTQAVDGIVTYGNEVIKNSYRKYYNGPIFPLHNVHFKFRDSVEVLAEKKDWKIARNNFFFIIGAGAVHKGFDVVLDLFAKHPDWELHIGAPIGREKRFFDIYKEILSLPNIHHYGFIDMTSNEYLDLVKKCGFYLSPTVSEGCPTSVVNICSNGKCIPIATKESGLEGGFEIPIESISVKELEKSILLAQAKSDAELEEISTAAYKYFTTVHSLENYRKELKTAVSAILKNDL